MKLFLIISMAPLFGVILMARAVAEAILQSIWSLVKLWRKRPERRPT